MDESLKKALERASQIVASWPAWKQTALLVTAMATNPTAREVVKPRETKP